MRPPTTPGEVFWQAMICAGATIFLAVGFVVLFEGKAASWTGLLYWLKIFGYLASYPLMIYVGALIAENKTKWYGTLGEIAMIPIWFFLSIVGLYGVSMVGVNIYRESRTLFLTTCAIVFFAFSYWVAGRRDKNDE